MTMSFREVDMADAKILFLPVCSKCRQIIYDTIDYKTEVAGLIRVNIHNPDIKEIRAMPAKLIFPHQCKNCGAVFENITMPTKLPFYGEDYKEINYERES